MKRQKIEAPGLHLILSLRDTAEDVKRQIALYAHSSVDQESGRVVVDKLLFIGALPSSEYRAAYGLFDPSVADCMTGWVIRSVRFDAAAVMQKLVPLFIPHFQHTSDLVINIDAGDVSVLTQLGTLPNVTDLFVAISGPPNPNHQDAGEWPSLHRLGVDERAHSDGTISADVLLMNRGFEDLWFMEDILPILSQKCNRTLRRLGCVVDQERPASIKRLQSLYVLNDLDLQIRERSRCGVSLGPLYGPPLRSLRIRTLVCYKGREYPRMFTDTRIYRHPTLQSLTIVDEDSIAVEDRENLTKIWMQSWDHDQFRTTITKHLPRSLPNELIGLIASFARRGKHDLQFKVE